MNKKFSNSVSHWRISGVIGIRQTAKTCQRVIQLILYPPSKLLKLSYVGSLWSFAKQSHAIFQFFFCCFANTKAVQERSSFSVAITERCFNMLRDFRVFRDFCILKRGKKKKTLTDFSRCLEHPVGNLLETQKL